METLLAVLICVAVLCIFVAKEYAYNCLPKSHFLNGTLNRSLYAKSQGEPLGWYRGTGASGGDFEIDHLGSDLGGGDIGGDIGGD